MLIVSLLLSLLLHTHSISCVPRTIPAHESADSSFQLLGRISVVSTSLYKFRFQRTTALVLDIHLKSN
jgi:hypothetical protein